MRSFYSLIFGLSSEEGHLYHYHRSIERAVSLIGWKYRAIVPKKCSFSSLPETWLPRLAFDPWDLSKNFRHRFKTLLRNFFPLRKLLYSLRKDASAIVFLESFELQHLAALFLALLFVKNAKKTYQKHIISIATCFIL